MNERLAFGYGTRGYAGDAPAQTVTREIAADGASARVSPRGAPRAATDWAFVGLMLFTAVLYFRPQDTIPALRVLHLAELAALGALAAMIAGRLGRGLPATRVTPELLGVLALGAIILGTAPFSIWMGGAVGTFTDMFVKVTLIFILIVNTLSSPKRIEQFTWLIVVATTYIAVRAVFDYTRGVNLIETGRVKGAVGGMFGNPNDLALNLVVVLPLTISLALRRSSRVRQLAAIGCALLMLAAIVATHSRSGTVGLAVMVLVLGVQVARRTPGLAFAGALALALAVPLLPASYWERMSSITDGSRDQTGSREARSILLRESFNTFLERPLTGVGAGQFKNFKPEQREEAWNETHNVLLQVAAELGVAGLGVFLFLLVRAVYATVQTRRLLDRAADVGAKPRRRRPPARGRARAPYEAAVLTPDEHQQLDLHNTVIVASVAGWFVCALFASVAYHWTFYYLLALAAAPRDILTERLAPRPRQRRAAPAPAVAGSRLAVRA